MVRAAILILVIFYRILAMFLAKVGHVAYQTKAFDEIYQIIEEFMRFYDFYRNYVNKIKISVNSC